MFDSERMPVYSSINEQDSEYYQLWLELVLIWLFPCLKFL